MTTKHSIKPDRITKPIQLLAAWLVGLIVVDGSFLLAGVKMDPGSWERGALVLASIGNVPLFLLALFVLQTRFRPELQEDSYYAEYLDKRTNEIVMVDRTSYLAREIVSIRSDLRLLANQASLNQSPAAERLPSRQLRVGLNRHFAELSEELEAASLPVANLFGTSKIPQQRVVAIAEYLHFEDKVRVLRVAVRMNLAGYTYFDPMEEHIEEDVLIGAYGGITFVITPELSELLAASPEPADIRLYEEQNSASAVRSKIL